MTTKQRDRLLKLSITKNADGYERNIVCSTCEQADASLLKDYDKPEQWEVDEADGSQCLICREYY